MTLGFTGVVWLPRGATWNSTALNAGVGPVGFGAAHTAWTAVSTGLADASVTLARVMATLGAGWEGVAADAALSKLAPFRVWTDESAALAATTAAKAGAEAAAHTVARAAMPSAAEIAAVKASKVAAHTVGGSLAGAGAVAEAADRALDIRAGLVMEAYESASAIVTVPERFTPPPPLSAASGSTASGSAASGSAVSGSAVSDAAQAVPAHVASTEFAVAPAQAVVGSVLAGVHDPAVVSAASHAGSLAGSGVGAVASAASAPTPAAAGTLPAAVSHGGRDPGRPGTAAGRGTGDHGTGGRGTGGGAQVAGVAGRTGVGASAVGGTAAGRVGAADGWAGTPAGAGEPLPGGRAATAGGSGLVDGPARVDPAAATRPAPMSATGVRGIDDDEEHRTPGYLRSFEHFEDGRVVIPAVIGADPADR